MGSSCGRCGPAAGAAGAAGEEPVPVLAARRMGWRPDLPDFRDKVLAFEPARAARLPGRVDLRPLERFQVYDQGHLGSCTANAICAAFHFEQVRQGLEGFVPSRLFVYFNERAMEGSEDQDAGAYIRDGIKCLHQLGVCNEATLWPYDETMFKVKPPAACYEAAAKNTAKEYARVQQTLEDLKTCISEGFPIVFGFTVFRSFQSKQVALTGHMTMPSFFDSRVGGHAVMACGYDDEQEVFIVRNSWGHAWGDGGYFYMPYKYITNRGLAQDFWAIKFVDGAHFPTRLAAEEAAEASA